MGRLPGPIEGRKTIFVTIFWESLPGELNNIPPGAYQAGVLSKLPDGRAVIDGSFLTRESINLGRTRLTLNCPYEEFISTFARRSPPRKPGRKKEPSRPITILAHYHMVSSLYKILGKRESKKNCRLVVARQFHIGGDNPDNINRQVRRAISEGERYLHKLAKFLGPKNKPHIVVFGSSETLKNWTLAWISYFAPEGWNPEKKPDHAVKGGLWCFWGDQVKNEKISFRVELSDPDDEGPYFFIDCFSI